jgi:integrase
MPGLKVIFRNGVAYASGAIGRERIRASLGTRDRQQAQELCAAYEARLWKRLAYGEEAVRTFEEAALSYLHQGGEGRFLPAVIKHFKGRAIGSIRPAELRSMALAVYPKASSATRNRQAIIPARAVVNHAHDLGWCGSMRAKMFDVPKSRKHKPVDRAWLDAFMAQADADGLPHLSCLVLFMNQTGARVSEAIRLLGEHVDLEKRVAVLEQTKTDEWSPRSLTSQLLLRMSQLGLRDGERVFSYTDPKAVNRRMAAVCRRAGIERRSTHSAGRHSFGTNAVKAGVKEAMDAGGWKSAKLFMETYVHSQEAGRSVAALFDRETGPTVSNQSQPQTSHRRRFGKHNGK